MSSHPSPIIPTCFKGLPICDSWDELKDAITGHQVIIITGETGSGKTTQLPKICLAAGRGKKKQIACTQPRRIAAISVAERVAAELGTWGRRHVGYKIRFSRSAGRHTRIKFITDGMLLAEMQRDRFLNAYDTIMVDEAHERSLNIDFILGALRRLVEKRHDLKVIITSATMDTEKFMEAFPMATSYHIGGRVFPVDIIYREPRSDEKGREPCTVDSAVDAVRDILRKEPDGDILVFLPTESDILDTVRVLRSSTGPDQGIRRANPDILPVYGRLSAGEQRRIFHHTGRRKIVVATNIAETSITVPGITHVVDSGLARISRYSISSRTRALPVLPISMASAMQRAGRAGRIKPGVCIRLYSREDFESRREYTPPEILRSNLAEVILRLAAMKLGSAEDFPFIDPPSRQAIREGMTTLREIGALDIRGRITRIGRIMARLPIDPRVARVILQAVEEKCTHAALIVAAALSVQDPRERPSRKTAEADRAHANFVDAESDFCTFINIWQAFHGLAADGQSRNSMRRFCRAHFLSWNRMWEWTDIFHQFAAILGEAKLISHKQKIALEKKIMTPRHPDKKNRERLHRSLLAGFLSHAAVRSETGAYMAARGREVHIFPGSALFKLRPQWLVAAEFVRTSRLFARTAAIIKPEWLEEIGAPFCRHHVGEPRWSRQRGETVATQRVTLWGLTLVEARRISYCHIDRDKAREVFIKQGLAAGNMKRHHGFLEHNAALLSKYMDMEVRTRQRGVMADEQVLANFYESAVAHLETGWGKPICNERDLARAVRITGNDNLLRLDKDFLNRHCQVPGELVLYPGHLTVEGHHINLTYRFQPGDPADGVSAEIPVHALEDIPVHIFDWLVPGLLRERAGALIKGLPKKVRKALVPVPATVDRIMPSLSHKQDMSLRQAMEEALREEKRVTVTREMWPADMDMEPHLRMHFVITDGRGRTVSRGDNLAQLKHDIRLQRHPGTTASLSMPEVDRMRKQWELQDINIDNYPDMPPVITVSTVRAGHKSDISLFPALVLQEGRIDMLLSTSRKEAARLSQQGMKWLIISALEPQFRYIKNLCAKIKFSEQERAMIFLGGRKKAERNIWNMLCTVLAGKWERLPGRTELVKHIAALKPVMVQDADEIIKLVTNAVSHVLKADKAITELRHGRFAGPASMAIANMLQHDLDMLFPPDFPAFCTPEELRNYPRYINAVIIMAQRAIAAPARQKARMEKLGFIREIMPEADRYLASNNIEYAETARELRAYCRELMVSVYAQELVTLKGISPERIIKLWKKLANQLNLQVLKTDTKKE